MLSHLKNYCYHNSLFASIAVSLYRRRLVSISRDSEQDFVIRTGQQTFYSSSPLSWFAKSNLALFEYAYRCKKGDNALIVGVEDGHELIHFCRLCDPGLVIAVEPTPDCIRRIKKLKNSNSLANLIIVEAAAGNESLASIPFGRPVAGTDLCNRILDPTDICEGIVDVPMKRLEDVLASLQVPTVDYLKINVEGAEMLVLEGLGEYSRRVSHICLSCHDFISPDLSTFNDCKAWLSAHSYDTSTLDRISNKPWENFYLFATRKTP